MTCVASVLELFLHAKMLKSLQFQSITMVAFEHLQDFVHIVNPSTIPYNVNECDWHKTIDEEINWLAQKPLNVVLETKEKAWQ
jgi:hypothetical protein